MAGEAVLAYVPDLMFAVQLREAATRTETTVSFVSSGDDFRDRLAQMNPALVILDLSSVGADLEWMIVESKALGCKVIAYGPHAQTDLIKKAKSAGCDAVYTNSSFKMKTDEVLKEWLSLNEH